MTYEFISSKDPYSSATVYVKYLKETYRCAKATLEKPEVQWPKGTSHEISRAIQAECQDAYSDTCIEFGLFSAEGKLVGFAES